MKSLALTPLLDEDVEVESDELEELDALVLPVRFVANKARLLMDMMVTPLSPN